MSSIIIEAQIFPMKYDHLYVMERLGDLFVTPMLSDLITIFIYVRMNKICSLLRMSRVRCWSYLSGILLNQILETNLW